MLLSKIIINNNKTHTRTLFIRSPVIATMNDTTFLACDFFYKPTVYHVNVITLRLIFISAKKTNLTKIVALLKIIATY